MVNGLLDDSWEILSLRCLKLPFGRDYCTGLKESSNRIVADIIISGITLALNGYTAFDKAENDSSATTTTANTIVLL